MLMGFFATKIISMTADWATVCSTTIRSNQYICETSVIRPISHTCFPWYSNPRLPHTLCQVVCAPCLTAQRCFSACFPVIGSACLGFLLCPCWLFAWFPFNRFSLWIQKSVHSWERVYFNKVFLPIPLALLFCAKFRSKCDRVSVLVWNCGAFGGLHIYNSSGSVTAMRLLP